MYIYIYVYIYIYIYILTCWFVAALITECFRARCLRRASKLLRPSPRLFPRGISHLEAPEALGAASWRLQRLWEQLCEAPGALGAAISRLQRLWEQLSRGSRGSGSGHLDAPEARRAPIARLQRLQEHPSRGSRGSGSGHREAPEALGAAISRLQRLSRPKWLQPQFYRVFSTILEPGDLLGSSPNGSGRLEEASSGFELAQEGFPVASSGFESAPKWPRGE